MSIVFIYFIGKFNFNFGYSCCLSPFFPLLRRHRHPLFYAARVYLKYQANKSSSPHPSLVLSLSPLSCCATFSRISSTCALFGESISSLLISRCFGYSGDIITKNFILSVLFTAHIFVLASLSGSTFSTQRYCFFFSSLQIFPFHFSRKRCTFGMRVKSAERPAKL